MNYDPQFSKEIEHSDSHEAMLRARTVGVVPDNYQRLNYPQPTNEPLMHHSYGKSWVERAVEIEPEVVFWSSLDAPAWVEAHGPSENHGQTKGKLGRLAAKFLRR